MTQHSKLEIMIDWPKLYNSKYINHAIFKLRDEDIDVTVYQRYRTEGKLKLTLSKKDAFTFTLKYGRGLELWQAYEMEAYIHSLQFPTG